MSAPTDSTRSSAAAALAVAAAAVAFFLLLHALRPGYFLWDDNVTFFLPYYVHDYRSLVGTGELPHVLFHQYLGQIYLGNGQSGVLYPPVYAAVFLAEQLWGDPRGAMPLLAAGHLTLAALGMLVLLRRFGVGRATAAAAALVWMSFPFLVQVAKNWVVVSYAAALLPWNLWLVERLIGAPSVGRAFALGALKALFFYQGYPQYAVMTALVDGLYLLGRWAFAPELRRAWWRAALAFGGALIACGLLAAPVLLPMLEVRQLSAHRSGSMRLAEYLSNALPVTDFLWAQLFVMRPRAIHQATGSIFYVGLPLLGVLAALLVAGRRTGAPPPARAAAVTAAAALALSSAAVVVLYPLPLLSSFRWHFKHFLIFLFFLTVAAALGLDRWRRSPRPALRRLAPAVLGVSLAANVGVVTAPPFDRAFGPHHLDREVGEIAAEAARRFDLEGGRVFSLWMRHGEPEMYRRLTFNYATLVGAYHFAGYDPIIASDRLELTLGLEVDSSYRHPLNQRVLDHLSRWSVRYLLVPERPDFVRALAGSAQLVRRFRGDGVEIYENLEALPWASFVTDEARGVGFEWGVNRLRLFPRGEGGRLRIGLAPLRWYVAEVDGRPVEIVVDEHRQLLVEVPPGADMVTLTYLDLPFRLGAGIAASALLASMAVSVRRRLLVRRLTAGGS